jgi:hypothetical protein
MVEDPWDSLTMTVFAVKCTVISSLMRVLHNQDKRDLLQVVMAQGYGVIYWLLNRTTEGILRKSVGSLSWLAMTPRLAGAAANVMMCRPDRGLDAGAS